ncbi:MAG: hypothetical protein ABIQ31_24375 [Ferruginibacter sp.]
MRNIIATWICIDDKTNGTHFPSAKGNSADLSVQQVYWRCVCSFFFCARYYNPEAKLVLFSNQGSLPLIDQVSVGELLQKLNVHFYITPFEYVTPAGYYGEWRNQFYEFSIFKFITRHPDFNEKDNFLLLDSDCIIKDDLSQLFRSVKEQKCITYKIDYEVQKKINGNSRADMKGIFEELLPAKLDHFPDYHGGEFFAATIKTVALLVEDFYKVWEQLLRRHSKGLQKLNEEAHVLSYLFYKNGFEGGQANAFVKRLWTDPTTFRNVELQDASLLIWHLPAEKRKGFNRFFSWLQSINFDFHFINSGTFQRRLQKTFLVPVIPVEHMPYYAAKRLVKKILS